MPFKAAGGSQDYGRVSLIRSSGPSSLKELLRVVSLEQTQIHSDNLKRDAKKFTHALSLRYNRKLRKNINFNLLDESQVISRAVEFDLFSNFLPRKYRENRKDVL